MEEGELSITKRICVLARRGINLLCLTISFKLINEITELKIKKLSFLGNPYEIAKANPLVSIIVPSRNEAERLPNLLLSIRNQSFSNIEVLIADYKSTDGTRQIALNNGATLLDLEKEGIGYACHRAALDSKGDIIIRTDADSLFPRWLVAHVVNLFAAHPHIMLIHGGHFYYDAGFLINLIAHLYDKYWRPLRGTPGNFIAVRRTAYFDVGGFKMNLLYDEDFEFGNRICNAYGNDCIIYDPANIVILTSARKIKTKGFTKYIFDIDERKTYSALKHSRTQMKPKSK
jgi:glycosyltransferase involved in cell wall biosynthesis